MSILGPENVVSDFHLQTDQHVKR